MQPIRASHSSSSLHAAHVALNPQTDQPSILVQPAGLDAQNIQDIPAREARPSPRSCLATSRMQSCGAEQQPSLRRHRTLLSAEASPAKQATELNSLLGNANSKIKSGTSIVFSPTIPPPGSSPQTISVINQPLTLEKARSKARVEVDLLLSCDTFVQGQSISGKLVIRIPKRSKKKSPVLMKDGKLRVIGFECLAESAHRHVFYQCSQRLEDVSYAGDQIYFDGPEQGDEEGYRSCREGIHTFPFEMCLPVKQEGGDAKGTVDMQGVAVRYITMISIKVKDLDTGTRSLAHFYRVCSVWPQLSLQSVLAPAPRPLVSTAVKSSPRGDGNTCPRLKLTARLPRLSYFAGQQCYVQIHVENTRQRAVRSVTLVLVQTTTIYKPRHPKSQKVGSAESSKYSESVVVREVAESRLEMGEYGVKGHASAKGWWIGVAADEEKDFCHSIMIPQDCLSVARSKLMAIDYAIRVTISGSSDVSVALPIRIVNMLSIDSPPLLCAGGADNPNVDQYRCSNGIDVPSKGHFNIDETKAGAGTLPSYRTKAPSQLAYQTPMSMDAHARPYSNTTTESTASTPTLVRSSPKRVRSDEKRARHEELVVTNHSPTSSSEHLSARTRNHSRLSSTGDPDLGEGPGTSRLTRLSRRTAEARTGSRLTASSASEDEIDRLLRQTRQALEDDEPLPKIQLGDIPQEEENDDVTPRPSILPSSSSTSSRPLPCPPSASSNILDASIPSLTTQRRAVEALYASHATGTSNLNSNLETKIKVESSFARRVRDKLSASGLPSSTARNHPGPSDTRCQPGESTLDNSGSTLEGGSTLTKIPSTIRRRLPSPPSERRTTAASTVSAFVSFGAAGSELRRHAPTTASTSTSNIAANRDIDHDVLSSNTTTVDGSSLAPSSPLRTRNIEELQTSARTSAQASLPDGSGSSASSSSSDSASNTGRSLTSSRPSSRTDDCHHHLSQYDHGKRATRAGKDGVSCSTPLGCYDPDDAFDEDDNFNRAESQPSSSASSPPADTAHGEVAVPDLPASHDELDMDMDHDSLITPSSSYRLGDTTPSNRPTRSHPSDTTAIDGHRRRNRFVPREQKQPRTPDMPCHTAPPTSTVTDGSHLALNSNLRVAQPASISATRSQSQPQPQSAAVESPRSRTGGSRIPLIRSRTDGDTPTAPSGGSNNGTSSPGPRRFPKPKSVNSPRINTGEVLKARLLAGSTASPGAGLGGASGRELSAKRPAEDDGDASAAGAGVIRSSVKDRVKMFEQQMSGV